MIKVNILKNWSYPDLFFQTPENKGIWNDIEFVNASEQPCDFVIVLNYPEQDIIVECPPDHVWAIIQEPPTEYRKLTHLGDPNYARIYTTDIELNGQKYFQSQPALPWHINRSYDFLKSVDVPKKSDNISWVTSNQRAIKGHRDRMSFLESIREKLKFDLFGRGFNPIDDKWQAIAPYRYTIAIENYSNPFYWSEKLSDCFLAWTMPIYYGCTRITEYFPAESMILIDIHRPDEAMERIHEAIQSQQWKNNLEAIRFAREQVLDHYQFFPYITEKIKQDKKILLSQETCPIFIPAYPRDTQIAEHDAQLSKLDAQLAERNAQLAERNAQLTERNAQLVERDAQLAAIYSSKTWRVALWLRRIRLWLAPPKSLQARMVTWLFSIARKMSLLSH